MLTCPPLFEAPALVMILHFPNVPAGSGDISPLSRRPVPFGLGFVAPVRALPGSLRLPFDGIAFAFVSLTSLLVETFGPATWLTLFLWSLSVLQVGKLLALEP